MKRQTRRAGPRRGGAASRQAFPVALYASLLVALLMLIRPDAVRAVQSACATLQCLPLRAHGLLVAQPVAAAGTEDRRSASAARVDAWQRVRATAALRQPAGVPAGLVGRSVPVRERRRDRGAGPTELVLAVRRDDLGAAAAWVTVGDALVGFLEPAGVPAGPGEPLPGAARVALLHRRERGELPRRVPAWIDDAPDDPLPVVVEPASDADAWPLRCVLPADPYRAASLSRSNLGVRTSGLEDDPLGAVPPGLRIGELRVYGYAEPGGDVVPIGLFVAPAVDPLAIHAVVVWTPDDRAELPARPLADGVLLPARASRLPVATTVGARWFLTTRALAGGWLRAGAAVCDGERLLGALDTAGLGYGVVAPFGQPGRDWPLTLVPDDGGPPCDVVARTVGRDGARVELELRQPVRGFRRGLAFSGAGGRDLPAGLWIGAAVLGDPVRLLVEHVDELPETGLTVHLHPTAGREGAR